MKSSQMNFFVTPDDLFLINSFLKQKDCLIIRDNVPTLELSFTSDIVSVKNEGVFEVYLSNKKFKDKIELKHLEGKNYYYIYVESSEVIQFSMGGLYPYSDKELHRGRFYCVHQYYDNNSLVKKDKEFKSWVQGIFKDFKKQFLKPYPKYPYSLFSEHSIEWIEKCNANPLQGGLKFVCDPKAVSDV